MRFLTRKNIAASVGNIMEWYDFCLYAYFAPYLATNFFPSHSKYLSLLAVFLSFASGYIMRPVGGVVFGQIGDRYGQGKALYLAIVMISIPTFLIGVLPTTQTIGIAAPIILLILRLLQGLSAGGQYSGSLTYLRNVNHSHHGAQAASTAYSASISGYLLASLVGYFCTKYLHADYAWRIPFLLTIAFFPCLFFIKSHLTNNEHLQPDEKERKASLMLLLAKHKWLSFKITLLACIGGIYYSSFFIFLISYMKVHVNIKMSNIFLINIFCLISSALLVVFFARLADIHGRKPITILSSLSLALLMVPAFMLLHSNSLFWVFFGFWLLTTANTAFIGACAVIYVESFPKAVQFTGCSLAYNIGSGIIAGLTPAFLTYLLHAFNQNTMIGFLIAIAVFAVVFIHFFIKETKGIPIEK